MKVITRRVSQAGDCTDFKCGNKILLHLLTKQIFIIIIYYYSKILRQNKIRVISLSSRLNLQLGTWKIVSSEPSLCSL